MFFCYLEFIFQTGSFFFFFPEQCLYGPHTDYFNLFIPNIETAIQFLTMKL